MHPFFYNPVNLFIADKVPEAVIPVTFSLVVHVETDFEVVAGFFFTGIHAMVPVKNQVMKVNG